MLKAISIDELVPGMYVNDVLMQSGTLKVKSRGLVKSSSTIALLRDKGIQTLEIDFSKSKLPKEPDASPEAPVTEVHESKRQLSPPASIIEGDKLYNEAKRIQSRFLKQIQSGHQSNISAIHQLSQDIIDGVFSNPDGMTCLTMIKDADQYLLEHCVNCSILMGLFARHMGFDKALIEELSFAGLLMDVGMVTLPKDLLQKQGKLNEHEWEIVRSHVDAAIDLLKPAEQVSEEVLNVVANHHERLDGSGYPMAKRSEDISTYARMAAIVDCFDAMISNRPYKPSMTPTAALKKLMVDNRLDQTLVRQFVKCIGVHPVGSLVKLRSGKLAIVVKANEEDPLCPQVMSFYSVNSHNHTEIKQVDLSKVDDEIEKSVRPEEFSINLNKFFKEVFLPSLG